MCCTHPFCFPILELLLLEITWEHDCLCGQVRKAEKWQKVTKGVWVQFLGAMAAAGIIHSRFKADIELIQGMSLEK